jgi:hypothetical protein
MINIVAVTAPLAIMTLSYFGMKNRFKKVQ